MSNLIVKILSADELFKLKLQIPEYQRPYTWDEKNIDNMLEDFCSFDKTKEFYMGTILLHENDDKFDIIDGQQRITTLILLAMCLKLNDYCDISYSNIQSQNRINKNYSYLEEKIKNEEKIKEKIKTIFKKIKFTVITTTDVDDAFIFFDTQNNRGAPPSVLVLLKAFNLRCIKSKQIQKECAKTWDMHERDNQYKLPEKSEKLEWLLLIYLYRIRKWRGNKNADFGTYEKFRDTFTKELRNSEDVSYKKFENLKHQYVIHNDNMVILPFPNPSKNRD